MRLVVSKTEIQKMINTSSENMLRLLEEGKIPAYKVGRDWKVPVACLEEYVIATAIADTERRMNGR